MKFNTLHIILSFVVYSVCLSDKLKVCIRDKPKGNSVTYKESRLSSHTKYENEIESIKKELVINNPGNWDCRMNLITCATMYGSNYICTKILQERFSAQLVTVLKAYILSNYANIVLICRWFGFSSPQLYICLG